MNLHGPVPRRRSLGRARGTRTSLLLLAVALGTLGAPGCSDDGGSPNIILTPSCMTFAPASSPGPGTVVAGTAVDSTCDIVEIDLIVTGVTDVFGASFDVVYNIANTQFIGLITADSFLRSGGADVVSEWVDDPLGEVTVGLTRVGTSTGATPSTGDESLVRLRFARLVSAGTSQVEFQNEDLLAPGAPPAPIPGVVWSGGTLTIAPEDL